MGKSGPRVGNRLGRPRGTPKCSQIDAIMLDPESLHKGRLCRDAVSGTISADSLAPKSRAGNRWSASLATKPCRRGGGRRPAEFTRLVDVPSCLRRIRGLAARGCLKAIHAGVISSARLARAVCERRLQTGASRLQSDRTSSPRHGRWRSVDRYYVFAAEVARPQ